jgi:hypothetical protein
MFDQDLNPKQKKKQTNLHAAGSHSITLAESLGSNSGEYKDDWILGICTAWSGRNWPTFRDWFVGGLFYDASPVTGSYSVDGRMKSYGDKLGRIR